MGLVEIDKHACETLVANRSQWEPVLYQGKVEDFIEQLDPSKYEGLDLLAGGVPCPPFSIAGKQRGHEDERDLFPSAIRLVEILEPRAVMIENVRGLLSSSFTEYRSRIIERLIELGYPDPHWELLYASDFGVPQLRPRSVLVALRSDAAEFFAWPSTDAHREAPTVGNELLHLMAANGWEGAEGWSKGAQVIAPTIVGGSRKHGGADLGPTRSKLAWANIGVDAKGLADFAPPAGFQAAMPRLTVEMVALLQGFPKDWIFKGGKTSAYRQVGNAFPPHVAEAVGRSIARALRKTA